MNVLIALTPQVANLIEIRGETVRVVNTVLDLEEVEDGTVVYLGLYYFLREDWSELRDIINTRRLRTVGVG